MRSRFFARAAAIAAVTALGGLGLAGLSTSALAATPAKAYDFNGDGYRDVAVGSPYGKVGTKTSAGFVSVMYGSSKGLDTGKKKVFSQDSTGVPGAAEAYDHFGYSLTSADFDRDGYADLAIGVPDEDTGKGTNAGMTTILWGTPSGLSTYASADEEFSNPGAGHRFGESMTTGDIQHDGSPELFITVPGMGSFSWFYWDAAANARTTARTVGTTTAARAPRVGGSQAVPRVKPGKGQVSTQSATDVNSSVVAVGD
ncbi:MAG: repeat protein, partial [Streptosporangiaceae bacterium]|nr:repeat protein [Streptosporangiaceae bacterium]